MLGFCHGIVLAMFCGLVSGFIPLSPSNDTSQILDEQSLNGTILLRWSDEGAFMDEIARIQVDALGSSGIEQVFVWRLIPQRG